MDKRRRPRSVNKPENEKQNVQQNKVDYKLLGEKIRLIRISKSMSQEKLAEKSHISRVFEGSIERGEKIPSLATVVSIAEALSVSVDELIRENLRGADTDTLRQYIEPLSDCTKDEMSIIIYTLNAMRDALKAHRKAV